MTPFNSTALTAICEVTAAVAHMAQSDESQACGNVLDANSERNEARVCIANAQAALDEALEQLPQPITATTLHRVCAWCDSVEQQGSPGAPETHTICPDCLRRIMTGQPIAQVPEPANPLAFI